MTNRLTCALTLAVLLMGIPARASDGEGEGGEARFQACRNVSAAGFFWVDTCTGKAWLADTAGPRWVFLGKPEGAQPSPAGTYIPRANTSGEGFFVLDTATGRGWWVVGGAWKALGEPKDEPVRKE